ncbi:ATPase, V1 complex, subunit H [Gaertneriomyces semiglobifer]|nr:ATPase, V1 complex, subunit H [Gaertneriomyces semiglobifer]
MATTAKDGDDTAAVSIEAPVYFTAHNNYLTEKTAAIRARSIPWEGYQKGSIITEEELAQIRQFEKSPGAALNEAWLVLGSGEKYIDLFLRLLSKLTRPDTIQNILVLIDDVLAEHKQSLEKFYSLSHRDPLLPYSPFLKLLTKDDEYTQLKAAKLVTYLCMNAPEPQVKPEIAMWITGRLRDENPAIVDIAVQLLQSLLSVIEFRLTFYQTPNGVQSLVDILKKTSPNAQMQYQVIYAMWLLTLDEEIAADLQRKYDVVPVFIDIAKSAIKEKVVRVIFSTFRNMLSMAPQENMSAMIGNKLLNTCETLAGRKWSDSDITEDIEYLKEELAKSVATLSTWDEYESEVASGKLEWSPPHLSDQFWKQNATKLNEKDFALLRALARLIATSDSPVVLAVAAHDIGQYVKYYPNGKKALEGMGAKTQVMQLMTHQDPDVRYQALLAVQ